MIWFQDREYPVREFRILNDQGKCVAISKVMAGQGGAIFEEKAYQYCVSYDLHVNALYRHRRYGEKMVKRQLQFC